MFKMILNGTLLVFKKKKFDIIEEGFVVIENGLIQDVGEGYERGGMDVKDYIIMPSFINSHTHIGDSFAKESAIGMNVQESVGPEGIKWKLYEKTSEDLIIESMQDSIRYMLKSGITHFVDFREGGKDGIDMLRKALNRSEIKCIILGRDIDIEYTDGLGVNVYQIDQIPKRRNGKIIAIHAGEETGEVSKAIEYNPDFIIHATLASDEELEEIAKRGIHVIVCPRSNATLSVGFPRVKKMLDLQINILIGTDNVMIASPNIFREMEFLYRYSQIYDAVMPTDVLRMATINAADAFSLNCGVIEKGRDANLIFIYKNSENLRYSKNIIASIVSRCEPEDVRKVMIGGRFVVDKDIK